MTEVHVSPALVVAKDLLSGNPEGLRELVRAVLQEALEAEMTETARPRASVEGRNILTSGPSSTPAGSYTTNRDTITSGSCLEAHRRASARGPQAADTRASQIQLWRNRPQRQQDTALAGAELRQAQGSDRRLSGTLLSQSTTRTNNCARVFTPAFA